MKLKILTLIVSCSLLFACTHNISAGDFKSAYDFENKQIGAFDLNEISTASLRVSAFARVFVSQEEAFRLVAEDLQKKGSALGAPVKTGER